MSSVSGGIFSHCELLVARTVIPCSTYPSKHETLSQCCFNVGQLFLLLNRRSDELPINEKSHTWCELRNMMMSNKCIVCCIVFLDGEKIWFGEMILIIDSKRLEVLYYPPAIN